MKSTRLVLFVLASAIASFACGDKLLHLSRIHRLHPSTVEGAVVVFARPNSLLDNAASLHLEKAFKDEGLAVRLVSSEDELAEIVQSGKAVVVIVDISDKDVIQRLPAATSLLVVPVIAKGDLASQADAKQFPAMIKSPAKSGKFVDAVDRAVDAQWDKQEPKQKSR